MWFLYAGLLLSYKSVLCFGALMPAFGVEARLAYSWLIVLGFCFAEVCSASLLVKSICKDRVWIQCLVASYWLPAAAMYEA